jgi:hypothetical protein
LALKITFTELANTQLEHGDDLAEVLKRLINEKIAAYSDEFVQDMSHISLAANYAGNIVVDDVVYLKDDLYRCDYGYDWAIGWTCSGTQESGRANEKVRFTVNENGGVLFKFLKLEN